MGVVVLVILALVIVFAAKGLYVVQQAQVLVVERLGKFDRIAQSGINLVWPLIEKVRPMLLAGRYLSYMDLREHVLDFEPQPVITKDNVTMLVDAVIYYQITDPFKAMYEITNLTFAIQQLTITSLRNVMGELALDETLVSRETVNTKLRTTLDEATDKWGVKVNRVELKNINPPREIEEAMAKQMKAERERRATVTEAEGTKRAQVLIAEGKRDAAVAEAEGQRKANILEAEGEAQAIINVQKAEADAIKMVYGAIHEGNPTKDLIAIKYLESLKVISQGAANKIFLPFEATGILGSIAGIAEIFKEKTDGGTKKGN